MDDVPVTGRKTDRCNVANKACAALQMNHVHGHRDMSKCNGHRCAKHDWIGPLCVMCSCTICVPANGRQQINIHLLVSADVIVVMCWSTSRPDHARSTGAEIRTRTA